MHALDFSVLLLSTALAACAATTPAAATSPAPSAPPVAADPSCPVELAGTAVSVEDQATGAALVFVTTGDASELRRRVVAMAAMHNEQHGAMGPLRFDADEHAGHGGHHGGHAGLPGDDSHRSHAAHGGHAGGMIDIHSRAEASDIAGGARISFVTGADQIAALQGELRMHAQHLASGLCTMGTP